MQYCLGSYLSYLAEEINSHTEEISRYRFISHSNRYAPSAPLYNKFKVLPIDKVNIYQTCLFMHKFIYRKQDLPDSFQSLFIPISHVHSFQTRHSNNTFVLPYTRTTRHQFNISFRGPKLWSDLSPSLRSMSSYSVFKKHLKRLLLLAWCPYVVLSR